MAATLIGSASGSVRRKEYETSSIWSGRVDFPCSWGCLLKEEAGMNCKGWFVVAGLLSWWLDERTR